MMLSKWKKRDMLGIYRTQNFLHAVSKPILEHEELPEDFVGLD